MRYDNYWYIDKNESIDNSNFHSYVVKKNHTFIKFISILFLICFLIISIGFIINFSKKNHTEEIKQYLYLDKYNSCTMNTIDSLRRSDKEYINRLEHWIKEINECEKTDYTNKILYEIDKIGYNNWEQYEKDILDTYILNMLSINIYDYEVIVKDINDFRISKVYYTEEFEYNYFNSNNTDTSKLLYIVYKENNNILDTIKASYNSFNFDNSIENGYSYRMRIHSNFGQSVVGDPFSKNIYESLNSGNKSFYFHEISGMRWELTTYQNDNDTNITFNEVIDIDNLNNKIDSANTLLNLIKEYRDDVYKPKVDEILAKEKEEDLKEYYKRKEQETKEKEKSKKKVTAGGVIWWSYSS